jgi:hypothetical protein
MYFRKKLYERLRSFPELKTPTASMHFQQLAMYFRRNGDAMLTFERTQIANSKVLIQLADRVGAIRLQQETSVKLYPNQ